MKKLIFLICLLFSLTAFADDYDRIIMMNGDFHWFYFSRGYADKKNHRIHLYNWWSSDLKHTRERLKDLGIDFVADGDYTYIYHPDNIKELIVWRLGEFDRWSHEELMKCCYGK